MFHPLYDTRLDSLDAAVFDLETTGLYPHLHRIIQVATIQTDGLSIGKGWVTLVDPGAEHRPIPDIITELTRIKDADLNGQPDEAAALRQFAAEVGTRVIIGHNIRAFDIPFVQSAALRHGIAVQTTYHIDTIRLMRKLVPGLSGYRLPDCASYFGQAFDQAALHDAMFDAALTANIYFAQATLLAEKDVHTFGQLLDFLS